MATALATDRDDIINAALRRLRVLESGGTGSANQLSDAALALNHIVKELDGDSNVAFNLAAAWTGGTAISAGSRSVNLGAGEITAVAAYYIDDATSTRRRLERVTWDKFLQTADSTGADTGTPKRYAVTTDAQNTVKLFVDPAPSGAGNIFHWPKNRIDLFDNASDTSDLPDAWMRYLVLRLTQDLAWEHGALLEEYDRYKKEADEAYAKLVQFEADQANQTILHKPDILVTEQKLG